MTTLPPGGYPRLVGGYAANKSLDSDALAGQREGEKWLQILKKGKSEPMNDICTALMFSSQVVRTPN